MLHVPTRPLLGVLALALLTAAPAAAQDFYGIRIDTDNVAFLIDASGSMENLDEGVPASEPVRVVLDQTERRVGGRLGRLGRRVLGRARSETTKMGAARRELIRALDGVASDARFTIITFGAEADEWPGGYRAIGGASRRAAQAFVAGLRAGGGTPLSGALERAYAHDAVDTVFLVSDGRPTDGAAAAVLERVADWDRGRGVVVHTVGIGPDQDEGLLCELAERTGGVYVRDGEVACQ